MIDTLFMTPYTAKGFTLAFPEPMDSQDRENFARSAAPNVQLWWGSSGADSGTLGWLGQREVRAPWGIEPVRIVMRIDEQDWHWYAHTPGKFSSDMAARQSLSNGRIVAVILGNEPEPPGDGLRWRQADGYRVEDWGNQGSPSRIELYRVGLANMVRELASWNVQVVAGAYAQHGYTEDDAPDPGLFTWRELMLPITNRLHGHGAHYYGGGWWVRDPEQPDANGQFNPQAWREYARRLVGARLATQTNVNRFKHWVRFMSGFHHVPVWIDELNVTNGSMSQLEHMEAVIGASKLLAHARNPEGYLLGERVAMLAGFTSNGLANHYPVQHIMRDPRCYALVVEHMHEEGWEPGGPA